MANGQFDAVRFLAATGSFRWSVDPISLAVLSDYTFDPEHATMVDVTASGGRVVASARIEDRSVGVDGSLISNDVSVLKVPAGTYKTIIMLDSGVGTIFPLFYFDQTNAAAPLTVATNGDLIFRPNGNAGDGVWGKV